MYMFLRFPNSNRLKKMAMTISAPPMVGVANLCRVISFRSACSNSGTSPTFLRIRKRITRGPSRITSTKLVTPAPPIRRPSPAREK